MSAATTIAVPPGDPTNDFRVRPPPPCVGCGGIAHGSVGAELRCLRARVAASGESEALRTLREENERLRADLAAAEAELAPWRRLRAEVVETQRRFPSHVGRRGK